MTFRDAERARVAGDADSLRGRVTAEMYAELRAFCEESRTTGRSVRIDELDVDAEVTEAWQDGDQDYVTACVAGTTHTIGDATGPVVSGLSPAIGSPATSPNRPLIDGQGDV